MSKKSGGGSYHRWHNSLRPALVEEEHSRSDEKKQEPENAIPEEVPSDPEWLELPGLDDPRGVYAWGMNSMLRLAATAEDPRVRFAASQFICQEFH